MTNSVYLRAFALENGVYRQATEAELDEDDFVGLWSVYFGEAARVDTWMADFNDRKAAGAFATELCKSHNAPFIEGFAS